MDKCEWCGITLIEEHRYCASAFLAGQLKELNKRLNILERLNQNAGGA